VTDRIWWHDRAGELAHAFTGSHAQTLCGRWAWSSMFTPDALLELCAVCDERVHGWPTSDLAFGRAFRGAIAAAEAAGYRRPGLMPVTEGWEAWAVVVEGRRFLRTLRVTHRDPEQALLELAEKLRGAR